MEHLKERVKQSGLRQNYIAEKLGITSAYLTMMLGGKAPMSEDVRTKIISIITPASLKK